MERNARAALLGLLLLTWLCVYVGGMFQPGLLDDADSIHAEASREMLRDHDWVTLHIDNGVRYLEKAPLQYWMVTASFLLFGVHDWAARLPLVLSVLAFAACLYAFGKRFWGEAAGWYAALILLTGPGIYLYTRFIIPDLLVGLWLTLSLYFFLTAYEQETPSRRACWGLAVTAALSVLTKGLEGLAFTALIILVFLGLVGNLGFLKKMRLVTSTAIFLVVAAPWHVLAALRNPARPGGPERSFLWIYFVNEQVLRYLNKRFPHDYDKVPLLLFWLLAIVWLLPWTTFLWPALRQVPLRLREWRASLDARGRANLLALVWVLFILVFFSFSSRQEYYLLPGLPGLALLLGGWLEKEAAEGHDGPARRSGRRIAAGLAAFGSAAFLTAEGLFLAAKPLPSGTQISDVLIDRPGTYHLSLDHLRDLTTRSLGIFRAPLWEIGVFLLAGTWLNWWFRRRGSPARGNLALGAMMIGVLFCVHQGFVIFSPELTSKPLAMAIRAEFRPGETIVVNGEYAWASTLNYYTRERLHLVNTKRSTVLWGSLFPDAPEIFETNASLARMWNGETRVYLFTKEFNARLALADIGAGRVFLLARQGNKLILTNRPEGATPYAGFGTSSERPRQHCEASAPTCTAFAGRFPG